jgi:hypothetical protein
MTVPWRLRWGEPCPICGAEMVQEYGSYGSETRDGVTVVSRQPDVTRCEAGHGWDEMALAKIDASDLDDDRKRTLRHYLGVD